MEVSENAESWYRPILGEKQLSTVDPHLVKSLLASANACGAVYFLSPQRVAGEFRTKHDMVHDVPFFGLMEVGDDFGRTSHQAFFQISRYQDVFRGNWQDFFSLLKIVFLGRQGMARHGKAWQGGRSESFSACRLWKKLVYQLCGHTLPISIERLQARNGSRICASHHNIMCQSPRESQGRRFYWNRKMQRKKLGKLCVCWWNQLEDQHPHQFAQQSRFGPVRSWWNLYRKYYIPRGVCMYIKIYTVHMKC